MPAWSWYVPLILMVVLIAALLTYSHFITTFRPLVPVLFGWPVGAVMVGVVVGEPQSMEIVRSRGDRGPKGFGEFIGMWVVGALIMLIAKAWRRGRGSEGGGWDEGGGCDDGGD